MVELLAAFRSADPRGGPPPPPERRVRGEFEVLELEQVRAELFGGVVRSLVGEVDPDQARLFARRLRAVDEALGRVGDASGRLMREGLRVRARGILAAPGPRALRLRALADFYYSHLGQLRCRRGGARGPALTQLLARPPWRELAAGLEHARITGPSAQGPVHINVLRVDPRRVRVEAHDCREGLRRGQGFADVIEERGAAAAVSGGFFLYSEPDIEAPSARFDPVGLLLVDGRLLSPPIFRRGSVLVSESGAVEIGRLGLEVTTLRAGGRALSGPALTRAQARRGPARPSVAMVGSRIVAVGRELAVPLNGFMVVTPPDLELRPGDELRYDPLRSPRGALLRSGIAGRPWIWRAPRFAPARGAWAGSVPCTRACSCFRAEASEFRRFNAVQRSETHRALWLGELEVARGRAWHGDCSL